VRSCLGLAATVLWLEACASTPPPHGVTDSGPSSHAGPAALDRRAADAGPQWSSLTVVEADAGYEIDSVTYLSDGLLIHGQLCRPTGAGPYPVIARNHGGFSGLTTSVRDAFCRGRALHGYVVLDSSYRGEDGSQGNVEVCLGEVDDVEAMIQVARNQPYVNPARVAAFGASHGGCITMRLAERDTALRAAVDLFGPTDLPPLFDFWQNQLAAGEPFPCPDGGAATCKAVHESLIARVQTAAGGTPPQVPQAYAARSPILAVDALTVPLLIIHGTDDYLVNLAQTCEARAAFADAGAPAKAWFLGANLAERASNLCGGGFITDAGVPMQQTDWRASNRYLIVFEGQGHGFTGDAGVLSSYQAVTFLLSRL
jgi:dienelactone hydrolase